MPGSRHSSVGIYLIAARCSNFTTKVRIIIMTTLISDKLAPIKVGFSMKVPVHQGHKWSTPKKITHPRGFASPGKAT
jgi:hypothetical protein